MYSTDLRATLTAWRDAEPALNTLIDASPALREAKDLARDLGQLGLLGVEALSYINSGTTPPHGWQQKAMVTIAEAEKPKGSALEFPILPSMRNLVTAAAELPQLKTMTPVEWKKRVMSIANPPKK